VNKMDNLINDIFININNIYDYLLSIDIKVEKEFKLNDYKRKEFVELIVNLMYYLGSLEHFIKEYRVEGDKNE